MLTIGPAHAHALPALPHALSALPTPFLLRPRPIRWTCRTSVSSSRVTLARASTCSSSRTRTRRCSSPTRSPTHLLATYLRTYLPTHPPTRAFACALAYSLTSLPRPGRLALGVALRGPQAARAHLPAMRGAAVRRWPIDGKGPSAVILTAPMRGVPSTRHAGWSGGVVRCGAWRPIYEGEVVVLEYCVCSVSCVVYFLSYILNSIPSNSQLHPTCTLFYFLRGL